MTDLEDLSAKAARLWLEFMQAQAKATAEAAAKLPEVTRTLAAAGAPLAAEVTRWMGVAAPASSEAAPEETPPATRRDAPLAAPAEGRTSVQLLRPAQRRIIIRKSLSRRRTRRA